MLAHVYIVNVLALIVSFGQHAFGLAAHVSCGLVRSSDISPFVSFGGGASAR